MQNSESNFDSRFLNKQHRLSEGNIRMLKRSKDSNCWTEIQRMSPDLRVNVEDSFTFHCGLVSLFIPDLFFSLKAVSGGSMPQLYEQRNMKVNVCIFVVEFQALIYVTKKFNLT